MAIVKFERTAEGRIPVHGPISDEDAILYASIAVASNDLEEKRYSDNFTELPSRTRISEKIDGKCYGGPFVLDPRSVWVSGDARSENDIAFVHYEATQNCVYFSNRADFDRSVCLASILSATDEVESLVVDSSVPNRWEMRAPADMPISVIVECFADQQKAYVHEQKKVSKASAAG